MKWYKEMVLDEVFITAFSFAVLVPEGMFKKPISIWIKELQKEGTLNPSGYYVFTDVPVGSYTLQVKCEGEVVHEQPIDLNTLDPAEPVIEVSLV